MNENEKRKAQWLQGGESLEKSREKVRELGWRYIMQFGRNEMVSLDDYPVEFESESALNDYLIDLYGKCLREGKPIRTYITPVSATIERKEGVIYK